MIESTESMTAKLCSFARAYHSNVGRQKIFDDYLAYDLMGKEEYEEVGQLIENDFKPTLQNPNYHFSGARISKKLNRFISPIPLSRIAFAEQELERFSKDNARCQYVICGAGMDTFSFRNDNPDIRVFELDHPDTSRYKLERIKQLEWNIPQNVSFVSIDFSKDDMTQVLKNAGFDENIPSFFAILGVTYYLTLPVFEQTIEKISSISRKGNKIVFDFPDATTFNGNAAERVKQLSEITAGLGEPMLHGFSVEEIYDALHRHGLTVDKHETPQTIQERFFQNRSDKLRAFENIHLVLSVKGGN